MSLLPLDLLVMKLVLVQFQLFHFFIEALPDVAYLVAERGCLALTYALDRGKVLGIYTYPTRIYEMDFHLFTVNL